MFQNDSFYDLEYIFENLKYICLSTSIKKHNFITGYVMATQWALAGALDGTEYRHVHVYRYCDIGLSQTKIKYSLLKRIVLFSIEHAQHIFFPSFFKEYSINNISIAFLFYKAL